MKRLQTEIDDNIDRFIDNLQRVIGEVAIEAVEQRLTKRHRRKRRSTSPHRDRREIGALAETLYAEICRNPGESMMVLAKAVGHSSAALALPARKLVMAGRVRKTGRNQYTRYFPIGAQPELKGRPQRRSVRR